MTTISKPGSPSTATQRAREASSFDTVKTRPAATPLSPVARAVARQFKTGFETKVGSGVPAVEKARVENGENVGRAAAYHWPTATGPQVAAYVNDHLSSQRDDPAFRAGMVGTLPDTAIVSAYLNGNEQERQLVMSSIDEAQKRGLISDARVAGIARAIEAEDAPEVGFTEATAIAAATESVASATRGYEAARTEVGRLNAELQRALSSEPALKDPETAARFCEEFRAQHAEVYEAESDAAKTLADSLRAAQSVVPAGTRPSDTVLDGLKTLACSSEFAQVPELVRQFGQSGDAALRDELQPIAERAALTGLREHLAAGKDPVEAFKLVGSMLGAVGFLRRTPALSALGNAIGSGADMSEFIRTGDPASLKAAGFGALGAAAAITAMVATGPVAVGAGVVGAAALVGKAVYRKVAGDNAYHSVVDEALLRTLGATPSELETLRSMGGHALAAAGLTTDELLSLVRNGHFEAAAEEAMLGQSDGPEYVKPLDTQEFDARLRAYQEQFPDTPYMSAHDAVFAQMQQENAANHGVEALRRVLAEAGLL